MNGCGAFIAWRRKDNMVVYRCDGCGRSMRERDLRYTVTIDVRAAFNDIQIGLADLVRDHRSEMIALIELMKHRDPKDLEAQVYKQLKLDLCPSCQAAYVRDPLHFHPEQGARDAEIDIEGFLRSLGFGMGGDDSAQEQGPVS